MREIKFRAWDGRMLYDPIIHDGKIFRDGKSFDEYISTLQDKIMQFTGLKDKNGVEIYVGDVIDWDSKEWGEPYQEVVSWCYEQLNMRQNDWSEWCEVIGNIYENPELLEVNNEINQNTI